MTRIATITIILVLASVASAAEPAESESPCRWATEAIDVATRPVADGLATGSPKVDASPVGDSTPFHATLRSAIGIDGRDAGGDYGLAGQPAPWLTLGAAIYTDSLHAGGVIGLRGGLLLRNDDPWFAGVHVAAGQHDDGAYLAADQWASLGVRVGYLLRGDGHRGGSWFQLSYTAPGAVLYWCVVADLAYRDWLRLRGRMLWGIAGSRAESSQAYDLSALFLVGRLGLRVSVTLGRAPIWWGAGVGRTALAEGVVGVSLEVTG